MWIERGSGSQDAPTRERAADPVMTARLREKARIRRINQEMRQRTSAAPVYSEPYDWTHLVKVVSIGAAVLGGIALVVWLVVLGVHADREFARDCAARGGWVNEDVGGHWETVPVTTLDSQNRPTVTFEQRYQSGPTYCVVNGQNVAKR